MVSSKSYFVERVLRDMGAHERPLRVLDMGCGTARNIVPSLALFPQLTYVGVEPSPTAQVAKEAVASYPNARVHHQLGYEAIPEAEEGSFDIVLSLSVLEHVKQLPKFIATSVRYAKHGGTIIHRYDLGHSLYPSSMKEQLQILLGARVPQILGEHNFVRYVPEKEVRDLLTISGAEATRSTYHQMRDHKHLEKIAGNEWETALRELHAWEYDHAAVIASLPLTEREHLFPSVAVWATKA